MAKKTTPLRLKTLNALLLATSLFCFLKWGNQSQFLFQMEYDLLSGNTSFSNLTHPLVALPMIGQLLLLVTLFQKVPSKKLSYTGMLLLGLLVVFILAAGLLVFRWRIVLSTLPFLAVLVFAYRAFPKKIKRNS